MYQRWWTDEVEVTFAALALGFARGLSGAVVAAVS
jgi:hypothetical protein